MSGRPSRSLVLDLGPNENETRRMRDKLFGNAFTSLHAAEDGLRLLELPDHTASRVKTELRVHAALCRARTHHTVAQRFSGMRDLEFVRRYESAVALYEELSK